MNVPKTFPAGPVSKAASGTPSYKRPVTVVATFAVAISFALAAAPVATASTNDRIPSALAAAALPPRPDSCDHWFCWPGWGGGWPGQYPNPGQWSNPGQERWARLTPSASTGVDSADLTDTPSRNGPLCPDFPGTCPPESTLFKEFA